MRILILTQKIDQDDAVLGFTHGWLEEFARQTESVTAICLEKGRISLPDNVVVFSLGKDQDADKRGWKRGLARIKYVLNFLRRIVMFRKKYDAVFVHMNPEYIVLGGLFWKLFGKTVALWYAHKSVTFSLRLAVMFCDIIFTSTRSGFRLPSGKVRVVGQGIDTNKFQVSSFKLKVKNEEGKDKENLQVKSERLKTGDGEKFFKIVSVGRVTPSKDYDTLIGAIEKISRSEHGPVSAAVVGPVSLPSDKEYLEELKQTIARKNLSRSITFVGPVPNENLPELLGRYDLFVNMGRTGSLDKAVPEAMAAGLPVLTCNEAFEEVLGPYAKDLMYPKGDSETLARKILWVMEMPVEKRQELGRNLRDIVVREHSLARFVEKIISGIAAVQ